MQDLVRLDIRLTTESKNIGCSSPLLVLRSLSSSRTEEGVFGYHVFDFSWEGKKLALRGS